MESTSENFYRDLQGFSEFERVCDPLGYYPLPSDWHVIVTDVAGSTAAIEAGRYKDVNAIGVSCIVAAVNACEGIEIPYVFGGDGATILVPDSHLEVTRQALLGVSHLAASSFELDLRVGIVPVQTLFESGHRVAVAKLALSPDVSLAMLSGDGVTVAEDWVKDPDSTFTSPPSREYAAPLQGFECRWEPIRSVNGEVVSLLVVARDHAVYRALLRFIDRLGGVDEIRPAPESTLKIASSLDRFSTEATLMTGKTSGVRHFFHRFSTLVTTSIGRFLLRVGRNFGGFNGRGYIQQTAMQTDFRKFDGALRMILDLDEPRRAELSGYLARAHDAGQLCFGVHGSEHALMTCFIQDYMGRHVHFVDGGDGGYAMAARQLKAQLKSRVEAAA